MTSSRDNPVPPRRATRHLLLLTLGLLVSPMAHGLPPAPASGRSDRVNLSLDDIPPRLLLPPAAAPAPDPPRAALRALAEAQSRFEEEFWTEAMGEAEKALRLDARLADAHVLYARAALQQGNNALAISHLDEAARLDPRDPRVHQIRGRIAWQAGQFDRAIESLRLGLLCAAATRDAAALAADPDVLLIRLYLGLSLSEQGYLAAAREQLEAYAAGVRALGKPPAGQPELRTAIVLFEDKVLARLADIHEKLGDMRRAAELLEQAAKSNPSDVNLKLRWMRLLARSGMAEEALRIARESGAAADDDTAVRLIEDVCALLGAPQRTAEELAALSRDGRRPGLTLRLADRYVADGRTHDAIALLEQSRAASRDDVEVRLKLVELYRRAGRWSDLVAESAAVIAASPRDAERAAAPAETAAADATARDEMLRAARKEETDPLRATARALLAARLLDRCGRGDEAAALLEKTLAARPDGDASTTKLLGPICICLSRHWLAAHRWEQVEKLCRRTLEQGFREAEVQRALGDALEAQDDFAGAEAAYRAASDLRRKDAEPLLCIARMYERRGDSRTALQTYQRILSEVDPAATDAHEAIVRIMLTGRQLKLAIGQMEEMKRLKLAGAAVDRCAALIELSQRAGKTPDLLLTYCGVLSRIASEYPNDTATLIDLTKAHADLRSHDVALKTVDRLLTLKPDDVAGRELKFAVLLARFDQSGAKALLETMLAERPQCQRWRRLAAQLALDCVDDATAIEQLRWLVERAESAKQRLGYQTQMLQLLTAAGRADEAVALARRMHEQDPRDDVRRELLIRGLEWNGRGAEAVDLARSFLDAEPNRTEWRAFYVNRLLNAGRPREAIQESLRWYEDAPDNATLLALLNEVLLQAGDPQQAVALASALRGGAAAADFLNVLVNSYLDAKQYDEAIELLQSLSQEPSAGNLDRAMLEVYLRADRLNEAERLLNRLLEPVTERRRSGQSFDAASYVGYVQQLSMINERQGKRARSEELLADVFALAPDDPGINNDLGYLWVDAGRNLAAGEEMIRTAVSQQPRQASFLDSLGWANYKLKRYDEAVLWLNRARRWSLADGLLPRTRGLLMGRPDPVDPVIADHLGDVLYRMGRKEEALTCWTEAVDAVRTRAAQSIDARREAEWAAAAEKKIVAAKAGEEPAIGAVGESGEPTVRSRDEFLQKIDPRRSPPQALEQPASRPARP